MDAKQEKKRTKYSLASQYATAELLNSVSTYYFLSNPSSKLKVDCMVPAATVYSDPHEVT